MVEVLVTIVILAFGLLGVAGLQSKMGVAEMESFQRSQSLLLLEEITDRINANRAQAANYATGGTVGTGDTEPADCTGIAQGPARDLCDWSNALKGAAEQKSGSNVGGMLGARGCIVQIQAPDPTLGACTPAIYQISIAWQGTTTTSAPALACGQGLYGDDRFRRVISSQVVVPVMLVVPPAAIPSVSCYTP
jgi:type IV pilus assembly protein PilV